MADNVFVRSKVGTRDELRSSHRREAIESTTMLPDGEDVLNQGMNKDKTILENSLEEKSIRASFCPTPSLQSDFPRAILLPVNKHQMWYP